MTVLQDHLTARRAHCSRQLESLGDETGCSSLSQLHGLSRLQMCHMGRHLMLLRRSLSLSIGGYRGCMSHGRGSWTSGTRLARRRGGRRSVGPGRMRKRRAIHLRRVGSIQPRRARVGCRPGHILSRAVTWSPRRLGHRLSAGSFRFRSIRGGGWIAGSGFGRGGRRGSGVGIFSWSRLVLLGIRRACRRRRCHTRRGGDIGVGRNGIGGRRGSAAVGRRGPNLGARRLRLRRASLSLSLGLRLSKGLLRGGHLLQLRLLRRVQRGGDLSLLGLLKLRQVLSLESRELKPHPRVRVDSDGVSR